MRIAIVDESASRASIIEEGLARLPDCEIFVLTERRGLVARIGEIAPDIVLIDLGNPSRDVLEDYFAVSRALSRPIAMFVDEADEEAIGASIDAGVSVYVVDGFAANRIRPVVDLALRRFSAFARLPVRSPCSSTNRTKKRSARPSMPGFRPTSWTASPRIASGRCSISR